MKKGPLSEKSEFHTLSPEDSNDAFTALYNAYKDKVYSVAMHMLKSEVHAEEMVQEVFLKIWVRRNQMSHIKNLESYIFITTRNLVLDHIKSAAKNNMLDISGVHIDKSEDKTDFSIREQQMKEIIDSITDRLPPQQKKVFKMIKEQGLSHEIVAQELNISALTVKKHLAEALKFIRVNLGPIAYLIFLHL